MLLYRCLPYLASASEGNAGHPLFQPFRQATGRIDNPSFYKVFYAALTPTAAVGEAFGDEARWSRETFESPPNLPDSVRSLVAYDVPNLRLVNLDDPNELVGRDLRPSWVVTGNRSVTQGWALNIFREENYQGIRWWSRRISEWVVVGMWDWDAPTFHEATPLSVDHEAVREAATFLDVQIVR